jgi:tetratricopeptide (TPR) repeat protein
MEGGAIAHAVETLEAGVAALSEDASPEARARLESNLARALMRASQNERAYELADRALALAERHDLEDVVAEAFNNKAAALRGMGRNREAAAIMQAAIDLAHAGGYVNAELRARNNLASVLFAKDPLRARDLAREAFALSQRLGHRAMAHWSTGLILGLSSSIGDGWDEALAIGEDAVAEALSRPDESRNLSVMWLLRMARGEPGDAAIARLEAIAAEVGEAGTTGAATATRALQAHYAGRFAMARDLFVQASAEFHPLAEVWLGEAAHPATFAREAAPLRAIAEGLDQSSEGNLPWYRAERARAWAGVAALEGRASEAVTRYRDAIRRYRELGLTFEVARAATAAVTLLGDGDSESAAAADEARTVFDRLGARPWLDLLENALRPTVGTRESVPIK